MYKTNTEATEKRQRATEKKKKVVKKAEKRTKVKFNILSLSPSLCSFLSPHPQKSFFLCGSPCFSVLFAFLATLSEWRRSHHESKGCVRLVPRVLTIGY
jgi:hypothetical protein